MADAAAIGIEAFDLRTGNFHHAARRNGSVGLAGGEVFHTVDLRAAQLLHAINVKLHAGQSIFYNLVDGHIYPAFHAFVVQHLAVRVERAGDGGRETHVLGHDRIAGIEDVADLLFHQLHDAEDGIQTILCTFAHNLFGDVLQRLGITECLDGSGIIVRPFRNLVFPQFHGPNILLFFVFVSHNRMDLES